MTCHVTSHTHVAHVCRSVQTDIWCAVSNELSGVYFTMARVMQDCSASSSDKNEVVREVTNLYNKSLRISEVRHVTFYL